VTVTAPRARKPGTRTRLVAPILVRQLRNGVEESVHRGDVVEVDATGRVLRALGDTDRPVTLRSTVKPFGLVALVQAGGVAAFDLEPAELAVMAGSHSGEDLHVRTLQALFRRSGVSQSLLACGVEGAPLDALTTARLARDGERPGPIRHMCSGYHAAFLLHARLSGWDPDDYWLDGHPTQVALRNVLATALGTRPDRLRTAIDGCGIATFVAPLREVARLYALLADPEAIPSDDPRSELATALVAIRDAMLAHPEMVGGLHDRVDTSMMKAVPGRIVSKGGAEGLRAVAILPGPREGVHETGASGIVIKIEDGAAASRDTAAASVEALRQAGALDAPALRALARYHRPPTRDPHGRLTAEAVSEFELAPIAELTS